MSLISWKTKLQFDLFKREEISIKHYCLWWLVTLQKIRELDVNGFLDGSQVARRHAHCWDRDSCGDKASFMAPACAECLEHYSCPIHSSTGSQQPAILVSVFGRVYFYCFLWIFTYAFEKWRSVVQQQNQDTKAVWASHTINPCFLDPSLTPSW